MNETELEEIGLQWFSENGWQAAHGPDIAPDSDTPQRSSYNEVLLEQPLREAIQRINPHLKREEVDEAIHKLRTITHPIQDQLFLTFPFTLKSNLINIFTGAF